MRQNFASMWFIVIVFAFGQYNTFADPVSEVSNSESDAAVLYDYAGISGGYARSYNFKDCPAPYFAGNSFEVIDYWPDGANIEVTVSPHGAVENGWTILVVFSRPLPKAAKILIWSGEETARKENRYLTFVNRAHNPNLNNMKKFSLTFVVAGASMHEMSGYSAMVAFYGERIQDASCYLLGNGKAANPTPATSAIRPITIKPQRPVRRSTIAPRRTTRRAPMWRRPTAKPMRSTTRAMRKLPTNAPRRPSTRKPIPNQPKTTRRPPTTRRRPATRRPKTTRRPPTTRRRPSTRRARTTRRPLTTPRRLRPTTTKPTQRPKTTRQPRTTAPPNPSDMPEYRISEKMVRKHKGKCKVLTNGYNVRNTGYDAGNNIADARGRKYRFNVEITIPVNSVVSDWTIKIVFAEPIEAIQTWEAIASEHSSDNTVWLIKPQVWNTELHETSEFIMIPLMREPYAPPGIVYVCQNGDEPTLLGNGIFERKDGGGHRLSLDEVKEQERQEKARQEKLQKEREGMEKERAQREREQRERKRKEREQQKSEEREQNNNGEGSNNNDNNQQQKPTRAPNNNHSQRPEVTTPPRPRLSGPRCSGRDGYAPSNPGQTKVSFKRSPANERRPYDYNEVLAMSIMFYEAQRSGKLPSDNRIPWRGDSGLKDGCDVGHDLTGGWYDAGDHVKFGFPMAWSATTLAWGMIEFKDAYKDAHEFRNMLSALKWVADYFVKAHTGKYELYGQIGDGGPDHSYWGKAEAMTMKRPAFKITKNNPGSDLAAETAAALAAISIVFKSEDAGYSRMLLRHAEELYEFADKYRGAYHTSISAAQGYYRSYSGYNDELVWGALWLAKASVKQSYLADGIRKYSQYGGGETPKMFSWDDKRAGSQILIAQLTGQEVYRGHITAYQNFLRSYGTTPQGMVWLDQWGSNRYAANAAFISLAAGNLKPALREKPQIVNWARKQIHLMLGDAGRSYVVGYGKNPPVRPHHRSSSCPPSPRVCDWNSAFNNPGSNYFTLFGALVGGPNNKGVYVDKRSDYVSNEVATDFNAGFQSALAGLKHFQIEAR